MMSFTQRQGDLLRFIKAFMAENHGMAPTFNEMMDGIGLTSKSSISRLVKGLEERGLIRRGRHMQRAIEVVEPLNAKTKRELAIDIISLVRAHPAGVDDEPLIAFIARQI